MQITQEELSASTPNTEELPPSDFLNVKLSKHCDECCLLSLDAAKKKKRKKNKSKALNYPLFQVKGKTLKRIVPEPGLIKHDGKDDDDNDDGVYYQVVRKAPNLFIRFKRGELPGSKDILEKFIGDYDTLCGANKDLKNYKFTRNYKTTVKMGALWTKIKAKKNREELQALLSTEEPEISSDSEWLQDFPLDLNDKKIAHSLLALMAYLDSINHGVSIVTTNTKEDQEVPLVDYESYAKNNNLSDDDASDLETTSDDTVSRKTQKLE